MSKNKKGLYDIFGDIHGHFDAFDSLMRKIGYDFQREGYIHPEGRKPLSIGDLLDKGPQQRQTLELFKKMVLQGRAEAIMGNHEFNAICLFMEVDGKPIREHSDKNFTQQSAFLNEYEFGSSEHAALIEFFKTFPVFMETDHFRAIHAFWSDEDMRCIKPYLDRRNCLTEEAYTAYARNVQPFRGALDNVLKGPFLKLPPGVVFFDKQGQERNEARYMWWADSDANLYEKIDVRGAHLNGIQAAQITEALSIIDIFNPLSKPTFFGHYSLDMNPRIIAPTIIELDFRKGITAYRTQGDGSIAQKNLVHQL